MREIQLDAVRMIQEKKRAEKERRLKRKIKKLHTLEVVGVCGTAAGLTLCVMDAVIPELWWMPLSIGAGIALMSFGLIVLAEKLEDLEIKKCR